MSHINSVKIQMKDREAVKAAAQHLNLEFVGEKVHTLFNGQTARGMGFKLPGWTYPVVVDLSTGEAHYDNYNESWGQQVELDRLVQRYSAEVARGQAEQMGFVYSEQTLDDGSLQVELVSA